MNKFDAKVLKSNVFRVDLSSRKEGEKRCSLSLSVIGHLKPKIAQRVRLILISITMSYALK